jgi:octaprenyl-diphosphate synthase
VVAKLKEFGQNVGMAFQIKDDLFDYGDDEIGKPLGIDIKEKKMTLPLIYALSKSSWMEKRRVVGIIRNKSEDAARVKEVIEFVKKSGGIEYAKEVMQQYYQKAITILNGLPETDYKTSLAELVRFTIDRKS